MTFISGGGGIDTTPVGTVVAWASNNTPPAGWLLLNGDTFSTTTYPQLATIFPSGQLPDLTAMPNIPFQAEFKESSTDDGDSIDFIDTTPVGNGDHSHTVNGGGDNETRPKNIAVHYIIKAREISISEESFCSQVPTK